MNPFDKQHVCLSSSQGWIYFVRDFKEEAKPQRVDVKYRINSGQPGSDVSKPGAATNDAFQHMIFSPHHRNIVYFVLERRILIFDLTIHQTVGSIGWDKTKPAFRSLLVSRHHEHVLFVLHDDGSLTVWRRKDAHSQSWAYQTSIDVIRISKQTRKRDRSILVTSAVISPSPELQLSLTSSDGVVWCVSYMGSTMPVDKNSTPPTLLICGELECVTSAISSISVWNDESMEANAADEASELYRPSQVLNSNTTGVNNFTSAYLSGALGHGPRIPPRVGARSYTATSSSQLSNLVVIGSHDGRLLLVDMMENSIRRMFTVQPGCALRGVRWISSTKVICFTTENIDKTLHRNRIKLVDLGTGQITEIRKKNEPEPTFIRGIRLSPSKTYLIVLLKDQPFQVWELKTGSLLRSLPFPHLTALEWNPTTLGGANASSISAASASSSGLLPVIAPSPLSPSASASSLFPPSSSSSLLLSPDLVSPGASVNGLVTLPPLGAPSLGSASTTGSFGSSNSLSTTQSSSTTPPSSFTTNSYAKPLREQFVFSNPDGTLYFFQVENNQVTPMPSMKVEPGIGIVASIAWKDNLLVAGDTNGLIVSYQLDKRSKPQTFETGKGLVRRIRFGPAAEGTLGYHNILVLFNDGDFGIWDLEYNSRVSISSYFRQRDLKAVDLDWWNAHQPIIATTDGAIRLVDRSLSQGSNSPILISHISYPLNCPSILPASQALFLKTMLNHPDLTDGGNGIGNGGIGSPNSSGVYNGKRGGSVISSTSSGGPNIAGGNSDLTSSGSIPKPSPSSSGSTNLLGSPRTANAGGTHSDNSSPSNSLSFSLSSSLTGLVPDSVLTALSQPGLSVAERALLVANYFGNVQEQRFWTLVIHAFKMKRTPPIFKGGSLLGPSAYTNAPNPISANISPELARSSSSHLPSQGSSSSLSQSFGQSPTQSQGTPEPLSQNTDASAASLGASTNSFMGSSQTIVIDAEPSDPIIPESTESSDLPVYFDLLLDPSQLRTLHMNGAALQEKKRAQNYQLTQSITDFHLTLGQKEKAMELLLETPPDNAMYYADVLKACVVAASLSPDTFRNTVKLVATSLIANGSVDEGVQLLSLIGKSLDACRYLQSHDRWVEAAQLAKLTLGYDDAGHIYKKWVEHLVSENQLTEAIEIEVTLGEYDVVLALLHKANLYELAALFAIAALDSGILTPEWILEHPTDSDTSRLALTAATLPALLESVFLDYGWYLHKIGCKAAATHFLAEYAGEAGKEALQNFNLAAASPGRSSSLTTLPTLRSSLSIDRDEEQDTDHTDAVQTLPIPPRSPRSSASSFSAAGPSAVPPSLANVSLVGSGVLFDAPPTQHNLDD